VRPIDEATRAVYGAFREAAARIAERYPDGLTSRLLALETAEIDAADNRALAAMKAGDIEGAKRAVADWERAWLELIDAHAGKAKRTAAS